MSYSINHASFCNQFSSNQKVPIEDILDIAPWLLSDGVRFNNAVMNINQKYKDIVWESGVWLGGVFDSGIWESGVWLSGEWKSGIWCNGVWLIGEWNDGSWLDGFWHDGVWSYGYWKGGTWNSGTWKAGKVFGAISTVSPDNYLDYNMNRQGSI